MCLVDHTNRLLLHTQVFKGTYYISPYRGPNKVQNDVKSKHFCVDSSQKPGYEELALKHGQEQRIPSDSHMQSTFEKWLRDEDKCVRIEFPAKYKQD